MLMLLSFATLLVQAADGAYPSGSTGLEWMPVASFVVPAVLLVALVYLSSKKTVRR